MAKTAASMRPGLSPWGRASLDLRNRRHADRGQRNCICMAEGGGVGTRGEKSRADRIVTPGRGAPHANAGTIHWGERTIFPNRKYGVYTNSDACRRTLKVKVENRSRASAVLGIRIYVTAMSPQTEYVGPWLLAEVGLLAAGDRCLFRW